jgi:hypothetical protein
MHLPVGGPFKADMFQQQGVMLDCDHGCNYRKTWHDSRNLLRQSDRRW